MKILFVGTSGVHHVFLAANLLLNKEIEQIFQLASFANLSVESEGYPIFVGHYRENYALYALGLGYDVQLGNKIINELGHILGFAETELLVIPIYINRESLLNLAIKLGKYSHPIYKIMIKFIIKQELKNLEEQVKASKIKINQFIAACS